MSSDDTGHTRKNENTVQDINFIENYIIYIWFVVFCLTMIRS